MASDYSGNHKESEVETYSFLLLDAIYLWLWNEMRIKFRQDYLPDKRRISYKNMNDKYRQQALMPFLRLTNCIPGILFTVIVDKKIGSLFDQTGKVDKCLTNKFTHWKPNVIEKIQRISAFGGLLLACMSAPEQSLLWITDEDEVAPNTSRFIELTSMISICLSHILPHKMGHFQFATTKSDDGTLSLEDLASISDLAAGALCEIGVLLFEKTQINAQLKENSFLEKSVPEKSIVSFCCGKCRTGTPACQKRQTRVSVLQRTRSLTVAARKEDFPQQKLVIMNWFCDCTKHPLKKIVACIETDMNRLSTKCINFSALFKRPEYFWHKEASEVFGRPNI